MKKSIVLLVVAAGLVSAPLFAEITFGMWGRSAWTPFEYQADSAVSDDGDVVGGTTSSIGPGWDGANNVRVGVDIKGQNDGGNYGFALGIKGAIDQSSRGIGDVISINDNAYMWINFIDGLKFNAGKFNIDPLRGKAYRVNDWFDNSGLEQGFWEDALFARFKQNGGVLFELTAINNLYAGIALGVVDPDGGVTGHYENGFADVFAQGRYALAYTLPDILRIKAQFQGGSYNKDRSTAPVVGHGGLHADSVGITEYPWMQIGADLYALPGLTLEAGLTVPFEYGDDVKTAPGIQVGLGAKATVIDVLTLAGSIGFIGADKNPGFQDDTVGDSTFKVNVEADYGIGSVFSVGVGFGLAATSNADDDKAGGVNGNIGINVGAKIGGAAYFGAGVALRNIIDSPKDSDKDAGKPVIAIPLVFNFGL